MNKRALPLLCILCVAAISLHVVAEPAKPAPLPDAGQLSAMRARFTPVDLKVDLSALPADEQRALARMIGASQILDGLFLRQVWAGNEGVLLDLLSQEGPTAKARLDSFLINKGPWSRLDHNRPFIGGVPAKPEGANFYPSDATKAEIEQWMNSLPGAEKAAAKGFFTTIRRGPDGKFMLVPYSVEYQNELKLAAQYLREAASFTKQPTLRDYLTARADAFMSNDYYASDVAWMKLDASIEPTIGPYETYEDEWFGFKAAFESFITLRDDAETAKLQKFSAHLQKIEDSLPIDKKYKNKLGALAPLRAVNQVYASGDGRRGVATAAFNLPNDERVVKDMGSKRVMLKNVQEQKFKMVLVPISKVALRKADQVNVSFDAFFTHILMHELMHGLGPHNIKVGGKDTTVREQLKELAGTLEEAKADVSGLFALQYFVDTGVLPKEMEAQMYTTFLASSFRTIRFGISEAHGKGMALQLNYLIDKGAFRVEKDGTFAVDIKKVKDGVKALTKEIMTLQAEGSYAKGKALLDKYANIRPQTQKMLDQLKAVPVDIWPRFVTAEQLLTQQAL